MRNRLFWLSSGLVAIASLFIYLQWTGDRRAGPLLSDLRPLAIHSQGTPGEAGNVLSLEVHLLPADYQSPERLHLRFSTHLRQARDAGLLNTATVVLLPEHVGTGLFAIGEKPEVQQARTLRDAMQWMALSNPWAYLRSLLANHGEDRRTEAVLRMKARPMARAYQQVFSELAREFEVTVVAGSIVLPEPRITEGRLRPGSGPLRQVAVTFTSQGELAAPLTYKHQLSRYEQRYSAPPDPAQQAARIETAAGMLHIVFSCDKPGIEPRQITALIGSDCSPEADSDQTATVQALSLPWNLVGSPRRPAPMRHVSPGRMRNLWLAPAQSSVASSHSSG